MADAVQPEGVVLDLALAVAQPGLPALVLGPAPYVHGLTSIERAAAEGVAFAVVLDVEVVGLDFDGPHQGSLCDWLAAQLADRGLRPVVVASGGEGHRHLFCRVADPMARQAIKMASALLVCGTMTMARPPLSPHRNGFPVHLISPASADTALEWLESESAREEWPAAPWHAWAAECLDEMRRQFPWMFPAHPEGDG